MMKRLFILFTVVSLLSFDVPFGFWGGGGGSDLGDCSWTFDGGATNEYIDIPDDASLDLTTSMSISMWFNTATTTGNQVLIAKWVGVSQTCWLAQKQGDEIIFLVASVLNDPGNKYVITSSTNLSVDTWYHLGIVYDGDGATNTDKVKIYINGSNQAASGSGSIPSSLINASASVTLGNFTGVSRYFDGLMADVYILDNELTSGNMTAIYNLGEPRDERDNFGANIVSMFTGTDTADGAGGVEDVGGNNLNDGTLTNMTVASNVLCGGTDYPN